MAQPEVAETYRLLEETAALLAGGEIPAAIFNDPGIFALEREKVFARAWVYLGHESEIPEPGDYVLRAIVSDQFVVVRDEDGVLEIPFAAISRAHLVEEL